MSLHSLLSVTMGVRNVEETAAYYADFGLAPEEDGWFSTRDAGRQLRIVHAPTRRLVELRIGVADPDDLDRAAAGRPASCARIRSARESSATRSLAAPTTPGPLSSSSRGSGSRSATGSSAS